MLTKIKWNKMASLLVWKRKADFFCVSQKQNNFSFDRIHFFHTTKRVQCELVRVEKSNGGENERVGEMDHKKITQKIPLYFVVRRCNKNQTWKMLEELKKEHGEDLYTDPVLIYNICAALLDSSVSVFGREIF